MSYYNSKYYYINLDHRSDRNQFMVDQFKKFQISNYERIHGIKENFGHIGCSKSHILAIKKFIDSKEDICFILEDDFEFIIDQKTYNDLLDKLYLSHINWNMVLLAANVLQAPGFNNFLRTCLNAQTTAGYMINKKFATTLLKNYEDGLDLLIRTKNTKYCIDQYWKKLQNKNNNWYIFTPKCGKQMAGFSDIENRRVDYKT